MSLMQRRRELMAGQEEVDPIDIPIGVNLFDSTTAVNGYWDKRAVVGSKTYKSGSDSTYKRFVLPYDSRATFTQSNLYNSGSVIGFFLVDQDGYIRATFGSTTNVTTIKNNALAVETDEIKIKYLYANCLTSKISDVVWKRTA